jgi:hypothetical protein
MNEFLEELTELSKKHGIYIAACGCCGSPWLLRFDPDGKCWSDKQEKFVSCGDIENLHYAVDSENESLEFKIKEE